MENTNELMANFTVHVDILGNGSATELEVIPEADYYVVLFEGTLLMKLEYKADEFPHWYQLEDNLDQETVSAIGDAIETKSA